MSTFRTRRWPLAAPPLRHPAPKHNHGVLAKYAKLVSSADKGAYIGMTTLEEKLAMRKAAIEGRPFGPGSKTEHEGKTMTGAQAVIASA